MINKMLNSHLPAVYLGLDSDRGLTRFTVNWYVISLIDLFEYDLKKWKTDCRL